VVIDFHTHAFPDELAPRAVKAWNSAVPPAAAAVLDGTLRSLLASMDRAGIERSVVCSIATAPRQAEAILRWSQEVRQDRIIPFASVHPDSPDAPGDVRRIAEAGLKGIKLHALYQGFALDEPRIWPVYEAVAGTGLVLLLHSGGDLAFPPDDDRASPRRLLAVHRAFPDMPMVAAHLGGWRRWAEVLDTLAGTGVYLDTSYTFGVAPEGMVREILRRHPPERILFGTDSPWVDQSAALAGARKAIGNPEALRRALGGNAARLLGLARGG